MAAEDTLSLSDQLARLEKARSLALTDAAYYPQIVQGILPIVTQNDAVEIKRWGADFLAETFASPQLLAPAKVELAISVVPAVKDSLEARDAAVLKSAVQCCASLYPLLFKYRYVQSVVDSELGCWSDHYHSIDKPADTQPWKEMLAIKSKILSTWDTATPGVRICCIKFAQKVVQVQTPGEPIDPRVSLTGLVI
jgi:symplekin